MPKRALVVIDSFINTDHAHGILTISPINPNGSVILSAPVEVIIKESGNTPDLIHSLRALDAILGYINSKGDITVDPSDDANMCTCDTCLYNMTLVLDKLDTSYTTMRNNVVTAVADSVLETPSSVEDTYH